MDSPRWCHADNESIYLLRFGFVNCRALDSFEHGFQLNLSGHCESKSGINFVLLLRIVVLLVYFLKIKRKHDIEPTQEVLLSNVWISSAPAHRITGSS